MTTYDERVANRLIYGMVFVPTGRDYIFPPNCVNCLKPATDYKDWEGSESNSQFEFMERRTVTTTVKAQIVGIPYCDDCSKRKHIGVPGSVYKVKVQFDIDRSGGGSRIGERVSGLYITFSNKEYAKMFWDLNKFPVFYKDEILALETESN